VRGVHTAGIEALGSESGRERWRMSLASEMNDLKGLEELLAVHEELGGSQDPELEDLLSPYRRSQGSYEMILKEQPFSESGEDEAKCFLMNDLILIGLDTRKVGKTSKQKRTGTLDKKKKKGTLEIKKGTLTRHKGNYKLLHYLQLENCTIKDAGTNKQGFSGLTLTHTQRLRQKVNNPSKKGGSSKIIVKIAKLEMWLPTAEICEELKQTFLGAKEELEMLDEEASLASGSPRFSLQRASSTSSRASGSGSTVGGRRERKWAQNRPKRNTLEKARLNGSGSESASGMSRSFSRVESAAGDSVAGGLTMDDIEQRYNVDIAGLEKAVREGDDDQAEMEVEFGEGMMGLSLGSSPGIGVIVGALQPGGFAEAAGVLVSDRVAEVDGEPVGLDDHWEEIRDKLKSKPRPVRVKFVRLAGTTKALLKGNRNMDKKSPLEKGAETVGLSRQKAKELQKILDKAARMVEGGADLSPVFSGVLETDDVKSDKDRRAVTSVLEEIFKTEVSYVRDLKNLVEIYILPLRTERVKTKCRDIEHAGVMCEHGLRSTCRQFSKDKQPLMRAEDLRDIFLNVETLMFVNTELLRLLEQKLGALSAASRTPALEELVGAFAASFASVLPFFKLYSDFCHQYANAVDRLIAIRKENEDVHKFIKKIEKEQADIEDLKKRVQSLSSLLIKPVQRICKYPLLFNELLKHATSDMYGRDTLEKTAIQVEKIAETVNKHVGESKQFEEFMNVYRDLGGEAQVPGLVAPSRRYIDTFHVMMKEQPFSSATANPRTLFIFSDLLIIAKGDSTTLTKRSLKSRPHSLQRTDSTSSTGEILGRTISRFFSSFLGGGEEDAPPVQKPSARKTLKKAKNYKVLKQIELARCDVSDMQSSGHTGEPMHTFKLTAKERTMVDPQTGAKMTSSGKGGTGKMKTEINRYLVICDAKDYMERVADTLMHQIDTLKDRSKETARGESRFGVKKEQRGWAKNSNGTLRARVDAASSQPDE